METLLTTPEKKRNIRSANNDLFLPYLCFVRPEIVDCLPAAAAAPPAPSGWSGLPGPARLIFLPVNSTNKTNLIPKKPILIMVLSWSAATSLLQRQKTRKGQSIVIHHTIYKSVAVGWQVNCSGHAQCATLRQKKPKHANSGPSHHNTYFMLLLRKTITTLTHNSTSKKEQKIKRTELLLHFIVGHTTQLRGRKKKKRIRIRLRKRGKKHFNPKQAIARWWETHP